MITVEKVTTKAQQKDFLDFPLKLYKGNPYYTPALYIDEKKMFRKDFVYNDICDHVYFNAYKDGVMAGRISGIIQRAANKKYNQRRCRFTRFDVIEDFEVAQKLFETVEAWAREQGMNQMQGPLGFSDLEREGMLVGGFEYPATFEETYNYPYYGGFMDRMGYVKEVDWTGSRLRIPKDYNGELDQMADYVMRRYNLHIGTAKSTDDFIKRYADGIFELIDKSYDLIYGSVPFTEGMKKLMLDNFRLVVDPKYVAVILDENDNMICFGIAFPAIERAVRRSGGHLTPGAIVRLLKAIKRPDVIDLCLIGVDPTWLNRGVSVIVSAGLMKMLASKGIKYAETNMNLEDNYAIQNQWKRFDEEKIKLHRCYVKDID
ncbi:MAG: hypothetical protein IJR25_07435 [Bacteroidales bacterium]|nr:hypothetical protein [Bacteroidales bacterium]